MKENFYRWRSVEVTCGGRYGGKSVGVRRKKNKEKTQNISQNYYFNYEGGEVGNPKLEGRWRKGGGKFPLTCCCSRYSLRANLFS